MIIILLLEDVRHDVRALEFPIESPIDLVGNLLEVVIGRLLERGRDALEQYSLDDRVEARGGDV